MSELAAKNSEKRPIWSSVLLQGTGVLTGGTDFPTTALPPEMFLGTLRCSASFLTGAFQPLPRRSSNSQLLGIESVRATVPSPLRTVRKVEVGSL
jgi:hypothetical protein